jgi:hypothetical protein
MKTSTKIKLSGLIVGVIAILIGFGLFLGKTTESSPVLGAVALQTFDAINATTTNISLAANTPTSTFRLGPTSQTFIAPVGSSTDNANRKYGSITNTGSNPAYCALLNTTVGSTTLSSSTYGFILTASSTADSVWQAQGASSLYVGQVWCTAGTGVTTLSVQEAN